jgi:hypothetical protein
LLRGECVSAPHRIVPATTRYHVIQPTWLHYRQSVYHKISAFCAKARYKHHLHLQTMKSLVSIVESGATERLIATNALSIAFEILHEPYSKKTKTLVLKVDGKRKDSSRFVATVGSKTPRDTISPWDEPDLECDVEVLDDLTDDEMDSRKRDREDDDDGDAVEGSNKLAKTGRSADEDEEIF